MGSIHSSKEAMLGQKGEDPEITGSPEKRQHLASADQSSPLVPSLSGQISPGELIFNPMGQSSSSLGLVFVVQWLQISAPPLTGVLLDAGILCWSLFWPFLPAIAQLLGPSLCPTGPGWAPLPPASHRPDPKSQFSARLLAFQLFKTFFFSAIYLISAPTLRSSSNPSTSKQSVLTTLGQGYLLLLTDLNCGDHILP